jgi:hypothetical protein
MHPSAFIIAIGIASASAALVGCSSPNSGPSPGATENEAGVTTPTFTEVYTQVIAVNCLTCHVPGQIGVTEGMLDMSTQALAFQDLVGVAAAGSACGGTGETRVVPSEPTMSLLYQKVSGTETCGTRMPQNSAPLQQTSINEIHDWIAGGALDN